MPEWPSARAALCMISRALHLPTRAEHRATIRERRSDRALEQPSIEDAKCPERRALDTPSAIAAECRSLVAIERAGARAALRMISRALHLSTRAEHRATIRERRSG